MENKKRMYKPKQKNVISLFKLYESLKQQQDERLEKGIRK